MNDYIELTVTPEPCTETVTDILAALLADAGYESFVAGDDNLVAYIKEGDYTAEAVDEVIAEFPMTDVKFSYIAEKVEGRDWNKEWEQNYFKPIVVADRCVIHSTFHTDVPKAEYDIVIDPKMAFGTGHHQTTSLIISRLLETDLDGKHLIDVGTGTGILAILAAMRGAETVDAIEIDEFAYTNAVENAALNGYPSINMILGDAGALAGLKPADILVANINRNIIVADMPAYSSAMKPGATAIFSGFYVEDVEIIEAAAKAAGLELINITERDRWASVAMKKLES